MSRRALLATATAAALVGLVAVVLAQLVFQSPYTGNTTVTLLWGETLVQPYRSPQYVPAKDGTALSAGDRVRTGPGSRALITFFEGSTMVLEPETEVIISSQLYGPAAQPAASAIGVQQFSGTTWHRVQRLTPPASLYQLETPAGVVSARGSLAWVLVDGQSGRTEVKSYEGLLTARGQGVAVEVAPFTGTVIERGQAPEPPQPAPPSTQRLVFTMTARVWLRVIDPAGRTAGFVSPGLQLNQIAGALVSVPFAVPATVTVPVEESGEYHVVLEGASDGPYQFAVQGLAGGEQIFLQALEGSIRPEGRFRGRLSVKVGQGRLLSGELSNFVPVSEGEGPGKFVRTRLSVSGASLTATAVLEQGTPTPVLTRTPTVTPSATATETPMPTPTGIPRVLPQPAAAPPIVPRSTFTPGPAP